MMDMSATPPESVDTAPVVPLCRDRRYEVAQLAAQIHAAEAQLLVLLAEVEANNEWEGWKSLPQWLSANAGFTVPEAQRRCRIRTLAATEPQVFERMAAGRFSSGVANLIADTIDDGCRSEVLEVIDALAPAQIATTLGRFRKLRPPAPTPPPDPAIEPTAETETEPDPPTAPEPEAKPVEWPPPGVGPDIDSWHRSFIDRHGTLRLDIGLTGIERGLYEQALQAAREHLVRAEDPAVEPDDDGHLPHRLISNLEAFQHLVGMGLSNATRDDIAEWAGDDLRLQIDVDLDDLATGRLVARYLNGGLAAGTAGYVTGEELKAACCDSRLQMMFHRSGLVLDYGRERRTVSRAQRRALRKRDGGCCYPGCHATKRLHAHHIIAWEDGGLTDLLNLLLLCHHHHTQVHREHIRIRPGPANTWRFDDRTGAPIGDPLRRPMPIDQLEQRPGHRIPIHPLGASAKYLGERLTDYGLDVFLQHLLDAELTPA